MPEPAPRAPIELPAGPDDHGQRQRGERQLDPVWVDRTHGGKGLLQPQRQRHQQPPQQVDAAERPVRVTGHEEHGSEHGHHGGEGRDRELPRERADLAPPCQPLALQGVFRRDRLGDLEPGRRDRALEVLRGRGAEHVVHGDGLGRLVGGRADHARHSAQRLLQGSDAGRVVELLHGERDARLAAIVAGGAHGLDQLGDVRPAVVVVHGRFAGGVVHGRARDARHAAQRLLHGGGARGAAHAFDREQDAGLTHAADGARRRGGARRSPARPPAGPSACSCRTGSGIRPAARA